MSKKRVSAKLRRQVEEGAHGCCEYCRSQSRFATESFSAEHIIPRIRGGKTTLENLAHSCQGCNNYKYANMIKRRLQIHQAAHLSPCFIPDATAGANIS